jgi:hypothetical protein
MGGHLDKSSAASGSGLHAKEKQSREGRRGAEMVPLQSQECRKLGCRLRSGWDGDQAGEEGNEQSQEPQDSLPLKALVGVGWGGVGWGGLGGR